MRSLNLSFFGLIMFASLLFPLHAQEPAAPRARLSPEQFLPTGKVAEAQPGATIRDKPAPDGAIALVLGGGGPLELINRIDNANGSWWYIRSEGLYGWVDTRELQSQP